MFYARWSRRDIRPRDPATGRIVCDPRAIVPVEAQPLRTTITRLPISGLVRDIGLSVTENPERPQRSESVWGPAGVPMAERPVAPGRELPGEATDRR